MKLAEKINITKRQLYWSCQLGGWLIYNSAFGFMNYLNGTFNGNLAFGLTLIFLAGILLTELLRMIIVRFSWLSLSIPQILPRLVLLNILLSAPIAFIQIGFEKINSISPLSNLDFTRFGLSMLNFTFTFFFWSVIYYLVHFIENYKKAEIENLRWQASIHEIELNKLKSQLNPHFMFNAMNSIRALVAENPGRAKEAITQLANLLRNTLQMGKHKFISLGQELDAVKDYLALELVRHEERLKIEWNISPGTESIEVPPLMIQTLVENGIKHGIAKLPQGGKLFIETKKDNKNLFVIIKNSGQYDATQIPESGFGMKNTLERLQLLYNGKAGLTLANENKETVIATLTIPLQTELK